MSVTQELRGKPPRKGSRGQTDKGHKAVGRGLNPTDADLLSWDPAATPASPHYSLTHIPAGPKCSLRWAVPSPTGEKAWARLEEPQVF